MVKAYDLVVVGAGTAALGAAATVRRAGWNVAVVDCRPFGGTCALRGCDPKKMLIAGAETIDLVERMHPNGIVGETRIDWSALMAFKQRFTDPIPARIEDSLRKNGIEALHGRARFTDANRMEVAGTAIEGRHFLVAAGAEPVKLGIPGEQHLVSSEEFLALGRLPRRIVFVGGGYIAAEFSHLAARAGAEVTVLQRAGRMLTHFDADLVDDLMEKFRRMGIDVRTRTEVQDVEKTDRGFSIRAATDGGTVQIEADLVVHAGGRKPDLQGLGLDAAHIALRDGKLALNDYLQSVSNPAVYAAGDAAQKGPPLTPVASHDAKVVADNLLNGNMRKPDYTGVPSVAFTIPPVATVGLGERAASERGLRFSVNRGRAAGWFTARQAAEPVYGFKVLIEEGSERVLGAHLVGPRADEVINLFALAIRHGLSARDLKATLFAYPTAASDIGYML